MNTPMNPSMRFKEYYPPIDKEIAALPTCESGAKSEPLLIPEYLFDTPEEKQAETGNGSEKHAIPDDPKQTAVDSDQ